jgi:hypothetical protein
LLGPDPGGIAIWTLPDYVALERFVRIAPSGDRFRPSEAGVYRWFGEEIL